LLEEVYDLQDALLVGGLINSLIRNADRVKIACLAQLVNVIAPLMTNADGMFRQTIYYPYSWALRYAKGDVLNLLVESASYTVPGLDTVPYVDVSGTLDSVGGTATVFVLNRDLSKSQRVELQWQDRSPSKVLTSWLLTGDDLKASNSFAAPQRVAPQAFSVGPLKGSRSIFEMPAHSYAAIQWSLA
jgi:alpha-N-arabinofuranosidase